MDDLSNSLMNIDIEIESSKQSIEDSFHSRSQRIKSNLDTISRKKLEDSIIIHSDLKKLGPRIDNTLDCNKSNNIGYISSGNSHLPETPALINHNTYDLLANNIEMGLNQADVIYSAHIKSPDQTAKDDVDVADNNEDISSFSDINKRELVEGNISRHHKSRNDSSYSSIEENKIERNIIKDYVHEENEIDNEQKSGLDIKGYEDDEEGIELDDMVNKMKKLNTCHIECPNRDTFSNVFETIKQERILMIQRRLSAKDKFFLKLIRKTNHYQINTIDSYYINFQHASSFNSSLIISLSNDKQLTQLEKSLKFSFKSIFEFLSNCFKFFMSFRNVFSGSMGQANNFNLFLIFLFGDQLSTFQFKVKDINFLELKLKEILKAIKLEDSIVGIKSYVEFLMKDLFDLVDRKCIENFMEEFTYLSGRDFEKIKNTTLHGQIITMKEIFLKFFIRKKNNVLGDKDETRKKFYILLRNLKNYFLEFFPSCCGSDKLFRRSMHNNPGKISLCFICKILICSDCTKYHKRHKCFDFRNLDYENLEADLVLGSILGNLSFNNSITILNIIEVLVFENLLKILITQNFKEKKKNFLNQKVLIQSIFSALNKQKYFSFSNEYIDKNNSILTIIEEYKKLTILEKSLKKQNHCLTEEFYINNLSLELNVNKFILNSNPDLNYDVTSTSNNISLMISQCNSVNEFYRENLKSTVKENYKSEGKLSQNFFREFKFENGWSKFSTDFKFIDTSQKCDNSNCDKLPIIIKEKIIELKNSLSSNGDKTLLNIIEMLIREEELSTLFKIIDSFPDKKRDTIDFKFRDEFEPKLEFVVFFVEDWLRKLCSIGVPVFDK